MYRVTNKAIKSLRLAHLGAFLLHSINLIATSILASKKFVHYSQPMFKLLLPSNVTTSHVSHSSNSSNSSQSSQSSQSAQRDARSKLYYIEPYETSIDLEWLVVAFFAVTVAFHFYYFCNVYFMKQGCQPLRWLEFSLSAGLMLIIQDLLTGIILDFDNLLQMVLLVTVMIFGYLGESSLYRAGVFQGKCESEKEKEKENKKEEEIPRAEDQEDQEDQQDQINKENKEADSRIPLINESSKNNNKERTHTQSIQSIGKLAFNEFLTQSKQIIYLGCVPFLGIWCALFWCFIRIIIHDRWPANLYWIPLLVFGEFIAWCCFVIPPLYRIYQMENGKSFCATFYDYEWQFILLSFIAKTFLGWVLFLAA